MKLKTAIKQLEFERRYLKSFMDEYHIDNYNNANLMLKAFKKAIKIMKRYQKDKKKLSHSDERGTAKWNVYDKDSCLWVCSNCGTIIFSEHDLNRYHIYCGKCGCKMEVEENKDGVHEKG